MTTYTKVAVRGALIIFVTSIIAAFLGYLVRLLLAKNLEVEEFGLFYSVFAFFGLFAIFKSLGFDKALIKFIPEFRHENKNALIKSSIIYALIVQLVTNIVMILGIYLFSSYLSVNFFHTEKADVVLKLMAISFAVDSFVLVIKFALQGFKEMAYFSAVDLIRMLLILTTLAIALKLDYGILSPIIAYIATPIILLLIFGYILFKIFPQFFEAEFIIEKPLLKKISKYSIFGLATGVGGILFGYTDTLMLTYFSGLTSVALYNIALPTAKVFLYFPRAIGGVLVPMTSELWAKRDSKVLISGLESLYKYSAIIIIPAVFLIFSFTELLITVLFGESYILASGALKILSIGMIFATINGIDAYFFAGIGEPQINSKIMYSAAFFNFIANLIVIPVYGINGAAATTTLSYFIMMATGLLSVRRFIDAKLPFRVWIKTIIAGLLFTAIIWALKSSLSLNVWLESMTTLVVAGIAYVAMLFLFKVISYKELRDIYKRIS